MAASAWQQGWVLVCWRAVRRLAVFWVLAAVVACFPKGWPTPETYGLQDRDLPFDVGPFLVRMGPSKMAVVIEHDLKKPPLIEWWPSTRTSTPTPIRLRRAELDDDLWVAEMNGLPQDVELVYAVRSEFGLTGPFRFKAGIGRNKKFRFAAFGDTRTGHQVHRALIESMAREDIDFVVHSGDLVEFGGVASQWKRFFRIEAPVISRVPLFAAVGNHDNSARLNFRRYFLSSRWANGERYFYQDWGDVRVVIMDSEIESRPGSAQYEFVNNALAEGAQNGQILIMSLHYPPYSSGAHGSNVEIQGVISDLAVRNGVEVVLAGHDHNYERTKKIEGVTYIVAASGGANIRKMSPSWFSEVVRTEPHYVLFDVEKGRLVGRAVNLVGETFDQFIIQPLEPRTPE